MRLKELSRQAGTSVASIKYYLREGLLPPGRTLNATTAEYGTAHLERLRLIGALRTIMGVSIEDIRRLVRLIDDPAEPLYEVLGQAQLLALGLHQEAEAPEPPQVTRLVTERGWTDATAVRRALAAHVRRMNELGIEVGPRTLDRYADAANTIAEIDVSVVGEVSSRDAAVLRTAVGSHSFTMLLVRLVAVAQAAHARRYR